MSQDISQITDKMIDDFYRMARKYKPPVKKGNQSNAPKGIVKAIPGFAKMKTKQKIEAIDVYYENLIKGLKYDTRANKLWIDFNKANQGNISYKAREIPVEVKRAVKVGEKEIPNFPGSGYPARIPTITRGIGAMRPTGEIRVKYHPDDLGVGPLPVEEGAIGEMLAAGDSKGISAEQARYLSYGRSGREFKGNLDYLNALEMGGDGPRIYEGLNYERQRGPRGAEGSYFGSGGKLNISAYMYEKPPERSEAQQYLWSGDEVNLDFIPEGNISSILESRETKNPPPEEPPSPTAGKFKRVFPTIRPAREEEESLSTFFTSLPSPQLPPSNPEVYKAPIKKPSWATNARRT
tara:strand:- start:130 stop:1179 length:1050 start_codon:yes stop_codon:yes gene_type:complete